MNAGVLLAAIEDAVVQSADREHRKHLGASFIGRECARQLWYIFRWYQKEDFSGRMLRLFERGQREEPVFAELLRNAGATVVDIDPDTGKQWRILDVDGHFGGSCDGYGWDIPQLPKGLKCLLEYKTHNEKSFTKLKASGLAGAKPEHFVQMQTYMLKLGLTVGLYLAVNKNDDEIYPEFIALDPTVGERALRRAHSIIHSPEAPLRISNSASWFACKFCPFSNICHSRALPEINCRTCIHSSPIADAKWSCARGRSEVETQCGCPEHLYNPSGLCILHVHDADLAANWIDIVCGDGTIVRTGPDYVPSHKLQLSNNHEVPSLS